MNFEVHYEKYQKFKDSAEQDRLHIQKHLKIRTILKQNIEIFEDKTDEIINEFLEIENKIRVSTSYGKKHNGELLEKTQESYTKIENICLDKLK